MKRRIPFLEIEHSVWIEAQVVADVPSRQVVLIVEDEARMTAVDMIEEAGFEVLEATNADEAILLLEARRDITVVFTDIEMPGSMDGLRLARAVRGRWPPIKIIATSGRHLVREGDLPSGGLSLRKPYSPAQISSALRDLTARPQKDHGETTSCFAANVHRWRMRWREIGGAKAQFFIPKYPPRLFVLLFRTPSAAAAAVRAESFNSELKGTSTMRAD
jgi:CheY-like chemotaxis protein